MDNKLRNFFANLVTGAFFLAIAGCILLVPTILVITLLKLMGAMH